MTIYIAGFICALVLAVFVIAWITYCMFIRERHKSEYYQYNISDLKQRNIDLLKTEPEKKEVPAATGILILPSRHKQKDESYEKRPDYPESPQPNIHLSTEKLIEIFDDSADLHYKDGIYEVDSKAPYHSDV